MKFSEKRTLDKRKKFEKELRSELSKWGSTLCLEPSERTPFSYMNNI